MMPFKSFLCVWWYPGHQLLSALHEQVSFSLLLFVAPRVALHLGVKEHAKEGVAPRQARDSGCLCQSERFLEDANLCVRFHTPLSLPTRPLQHLPCRD